MSLLPAPVAARLLRLWVRIPPGTWMSVCCECYVLSGRGLCDGLITRPEEFYRLWCVVVCGLGTSCKGRPGPLWAVASETNKDYDECKESKRFDTCWSYGHCFLLNMFLILDVIYCDCGQICYCKTKQLNRWHTGQWWAGVNLFSQTCNVSEEYVENNVLCVCSVYYCSTVVYM